MAATGLTQKTASTVSIDIGHKLPHMLVFIPAQFVCLFERLFAEDADRYLRHTRLVSVITLP
jgi:hypothetical protein